MPPEGAESNGITVTITVNDINEAPTAVILNNPITTVAENNLDIKVADIAITDDALGANALSLSGADATKFEIRNGNELWLLAGVDYEALPANDKALDVRVNVDDPAVGANPDAFQDFSVTITDVNENQAPEHLMTMWRHLTINRLLLMFSRMILILILMR